MKRSGATKPLVIVGVGGFSRETAQAVHTVNAVAAVWDPCGFVDDDPAKAGTIVDGLPVFGAIGTLATSDAMVVVGTGRPDNYTSRRARSWAGSGFLPSVTPRSSTPTRRSRRRRRSGTAR